MKKVIKLELQLLSGRHSFGCLQLRSAPLRLFSDHAMRPAGEWVCLKGRRAASALGLRPLQPYVPLCCGPSESGPARHIHSLADTSLDFRKSRFLDKKMEMKHNISIF